MSWILVFFLKQVMRLSFSGNFLDTLVLFYYCTFRSLLLTFKKSGYNFICNNVFSHKEIPVLTYCEFIFIKLKIPLDEIFYFALNRHSECPFPFIFKDFKEH